MRYIGILLMSGALIAGGFAAADRWKERLEILRLLRQMVYHLKNRILYANAALPEALEEVGARFGGTNGCEQERETDCETPAGFFRNTAGRLKSEKEKGLSQIWREEAERMWEKVPMAAQDRENLLALGSNLGYADRSMQERTLLFYLEQTDESIEMLKGELETRTRLFRCLGMTAGLFLMVLLA